jgi:hypothetical protein
MRRYITDKIELFKSELMLSLDQNDYVTALKLRAVQKEFEDLLRFMGKHDNETQDATNLLQECYTSREAAGLLGIDPSNVTRQAAVLHGLKIKGKWFFPKAVVEEEVRKSAHHRKPGRKAGNRPDIL